MGQSARVQSVDALRRFRAALMEFIEAGRLALTEVDSDVQRTIGWLEGEQRSHWERQKRKLAELMTRAKSEVYRKQVSTNADRPSAIEERKALEKVQREYQIADRKIEHVRYWSRELNREHALYKGGCQQLSSSLWNELPKAAAVIVQMIEQLEAYLKLSAPSPQDEQAGGEAAGDTVAATEHQSPMARSGTMDDPKRRHTDSSPDDTEKPLEKDER